MADGSKGLTADLSKKQKQILPKANPTIGSRRTKISSKDSDPGKQSGLGKERTVLESDNVIKGNSLSSLKCDTAKAETTIENTYGKHVKETLPSDFSRSKKRRLRKIQVANVDIRHGLPVSLQKLKSVLETIVRSDSHLVISDTNLPAQESQQNKVLTKIENKSTAKFRSDLKEITTKHTSNTISNTNEVCCIIKSASEKPTLTASNCKALNFQTVPQEISSSVNVTKPNAPNASREPFTLKLPGEIVQSIVSLPAPSRSGQDNLSSLTCVHDLDPTSITFDKEPNENVRKLYKPLCLVAEIPSQSAEAFTVSSNLFPISGYSQGSLGNSHKTERTMKSEKSREEVRAEREAKKKAKLNAKGKLKSDPASVASKKAARVNDAADSSKSDVQVRDSSSIQALSKLIPEITSPSPVASSSVSPNSAKHVGEAKLQDSLKTVKDVVLPVTTTSVLQQSGSSVTSEVSKSELKAARRLKQELQRAAKAAQDASKPAKKDVAATAKTLKVSKTSVNQEQDLAPGVQIARESSKQVFTDRPTNKNKHRVKLFNHLYETRDTSSSDKSEPALTNLHPAIVCLGVQYAERIIIGSNARCYAFMNAMKKLIEDYQTPPQKEFARGLETMIQASMTYLQHCRPVAVSMTNALRHLKCQMTLLPHNVSDAEAKKKLDDAIDTYLSEQIGVAAEAISLTVQKKISNGDVILTYGCSSLVHSILVSAHKAGTEFRVIVVDSRPWREGRRMLHRLVQAGLKCSFVLIAAASSIMREVTKILLGAHALLANGYVMSRAGSSQIALLGSSYNVPVLVCCETHKFCERVQTDAFVYNEIGDPNDLVSVGSFLKNEPPLANWQSISSLTLLNLTYDVTPPELVTAVVTELAILPCTSVPVILRVIPSDLIHFQHSHTPLALGSTN